jgi:putative endonuclease
MEEVAGSIPARSTKFFIVCSQARPSFVGEVGRGSRDRVQYSHVMPAVYILQSESSKRFYIGCADQPELRLKEHNRGQTISTRARGPWTLVDQERFDTLVQARRRERQLKSWKSHRSIQELMNATKKPS